MKKPIIIVCFSFILICSAFAQKNNFAVHISNPLTMFQKAGVKLEFRTGRVGILLTGAKYFGSLPKYSGDQGGGELRLYSKNEDQKKHEKFLYIKVNAGKVDYFPGTGEEGFNNFQAHPESIYFGVGSGVGKHFNFNHFFIDLNAGLKLTIPEVKQEQAFYITGPGSFLDLHVNLGFQF